MRKDVDGDAVRKVLGDLETSLEAYLAGWRRDLGIKERIEESIGREEESSVSVEREEKGNRVGVSGR